MNKLSEFFQDTSGALSASRLILILFSFAIIGVWAFTSVSTGVLVPIPESVVAAFGAAVAGKVIQKPFEKLEG